MKRILKRLPLYALACTSAFAISAWGRFAASPVAAVFGAAVLLCAGAEVWAIRRNLRSPPERESFWLPALLTLVWLGCQGLLLIVVWMAAGTPSVRSFLGKYLPGPVEGLGYVLLVASVAHQDLQAWRQHGPAVETSNLLGPSGTDEGNAPRRRKWALVLGLVIAGVLIAAGGQLRFSERPALGHGLLLAGIVIFFASIAAAGRRLRADDGVPRPGQTPGKAAGIERGRPFRMFLRSFLLLAVGLGALNIALVIAARLSRNGVAAPVIAVFCAGLLVFAAALAAALGPIRQFALILAGQLILDLGGIPPKE